MGRQPPSAFAEKNVHHVEFPWDPARRLQHLQQQPQRDEAVVAQVAEGLGPDAVDPRGRGPLEGSCRLPD
eukprot:7340968-Pyramimonas_sp.AAC.1